MTHNLLQPILLDVSSENKRGSYFWVNFHLFFLIALISVFPVWGGETDFKTFRKAVQKEIKIQKEIIRQDPLDFLSYFELGLAYLKLGRHEEEVKAYQEALSLNPKSAQTHYNLGVAYDHLQEGDKAIHHMQVAQGLYVAQRNHRKIRTTQRQLKRFYYSYPEELRTLNLKK
tara:strand:+ start:228 stop:743 length:516 start_codon:yes stop_codon:yes gene_type:complete